MTTFTPSDFAALTDDQIVELIRAACGVAVDRGAATTAAAQAAMLSEAERAQIAAEAARRAVEQQRQREAAEIAARAAAAATAQAETERQRLAWQQKAGWARAVAAALGTDALKIEVWQAPSGADRRVYVAYQGAEFGDNAVAYHATGNDRRQPGAIEIGQGRYRALTRRDRFPDDATCALCGEGMSAWLAPHHWERYSAEMAHQIATIPEEQRATRTELHNSRVSSGYRVDRMTGALVHTACGKAADPLADRTVSIAALTPILAEIAATYSKLRIDVRQALAQATAVPA